MKILVATYTYLPYANGVAHAAHQMVDHFRSAGHEVAVVTSRTDSEAESSNSMDDDEVTRFRISGSPAWGDGFSGETRAYQAFLRSFDPDIIIFHCWNTWTSELAGFCIGRLRPKTVLCSHGYASHRLDMKLLPRGIRKWLCWLPHHATLPWRIRKFDKVTFLSFKTDLDRFFDAWVAKVFHCRNTMVIPNGIDTKGWDSIQADFRQKHGLGGGVLFLHVANYATIKNQKMALDAFLQAGVSGAILVFIGTSLGPYGSYVQDAWQLVKDKHPDLEVHFIQELPRDQVISAIRSCDVAILSSVSECQPLSLLEAMACGKPFISTNVGCVSEFEGGFVVRNAQGMATQMRRLASDSNKRARLGAEGKQCFAARYCADVTGAQWLELLDELSV